MNARTRRQFSWVKVGILLLPDAFRLALRMARDRSLPWDARLFVLVAVLYNIQPVNLIPDFIPVLGVSDNIVVTFLALRLALRRAGPTAMLRHWPGTPSGYRVLCRLLLIEPPRSAEDLPV